MTDLLYDISTWVIPVVLAITVHEVAHGYVAWKLGDDTARRAGRLTLNPIAHVDPIGTLLLPGFLLLVGLPPFGFAKPVPVNFMRLNHPKSDMVWVAGAGPAINIIMASAAAILMNGVRFAPVGAQFWLADTLEIAVIVNLVLAVFNMIPIPPLDGGRVAVGLLPTGPARKLAGLERLGLVIIFGALLIPSLINELFGTHFSLIGALILPVVEFLYNGLLNLFLLGG